MSDVGKALKIIPRKIRKALKNPSKDYTIYWSPDKPLDCYFWFHLRSGPYSTSNIILYVNFKGANGYYPFYPPSAKFMTVPFHTNVYQGGSICVDIFSNDSKWSPSNGISCLADNMILLFNDQNINSPANGAAGRLFAACKQKWKTYQQMYKKENKVPPNPMEQDKYFMDFQRQVEKHAKGDLTKYYPMFPALAARVESTRKKKSPLSQALAGKK